MKLKLVDYKDNVERVSFYVRNVSGVTITKGYPTCFDVASFDGCRVTQPLTANLMFFAGIAEEDIQNEQMGYVQREGPVGAYVTNTTNQAVTIGDILIPVDQQWYLARSGAGSAATAQFIKAAEALGTATTPAAAVHTVMLSI